MNRAEAAKVLAVLGAAYPRQNLTEATVELYAKFMADLDYQETDGAVRRIIATRTFFPSVAEIRRAVAELKLKLPSPEAAWLEVGEYLAHCNRTRYDMNPPRWKGFSHPVIKQAAEVVGWGALENGENRPFVMAQYFKAYEAISEKIILQEQAKPALKESRRQIMAGVMFVD